MPHRRPPIHVSNNPALSPKISNRRKKKHTLRGFINFLFPDAISIFTFFLVIATILLGIIAYVQIGFLGRQELIATDTAQAAKNSADVAKQSLNATQRAFIRVANFPWVWRPDFDRPGKYFYDITPIIENGGNTPTKDMRIVVNWELRDSALPDDFDFPYGLEPGATIVGAHQTVGAHRAIILDDDLLLVQQGKKFFYIWGTITYRDVFENTPLHTTEFCTEISRVIGNPLDPREPGNPKGTTVEISFRIYPKHHRTD